MHAFGSMIVRRSGFLNVYAATDDVYRIVRVVRPRWLDREWGSPYPNQHT